MAMLKFILNNQDISTDLPSGMTVLDFVRYRHNLKGTKIGCREGDCGACTILVGELKDGRVSYRTMTSCLMPLANAAGKHVVTVEGINHEDGSLTPVQQAIVDESGTQCGFCTVGFVMSLTGFCIDETEKTPEMAISSIDGNICRCSGYKSIERAALHVCDAVNESVPPAIAGGLRPAINELIIPEYFSTIANRLKRLETTVAAPLIRKIANIVGGGTDIYVQKPDELAEIPAHHIFYDEHLRGIRDAGDFIEIGASVTVTDLLESPIIRSIFPAVYKHLKLVSSTPIRNMATLAGNFVNASPIGDMTIWFLALNAELQLTQYGNPRVSMGVKRLPLKDLYVGYKQLAKSDDEIITGVRFRKPTGDFRFNFEKVSKRTYLDIATVNTAISLTVSVPPAVADGLTQITEAHVSAGGVAPVPLYLKQTSDFLRDRPVSEETIKQATEITQSEISPISDVRGSADYKRLLLQQLFLAHFVELFGKEAFNG